MSRWDGDPLDHQHAAMGFREEAAPSAEHPPRDVVHTMDWAEEQRRMDELGDDLRGGASEPFLNSRGPVHSSRHQPWERIKDAETADQETISFVLTQCIHREIDQWGNYLQPASWGLIWECELYRLRPDRPRHRGPQNRDRLIFHGYGPTRDEAVAEAMRKAFPR